MWGYRNDNIYRPDTMTLNWYQGLLEKSLTTTALDFKCAELDWVERTLTAH